VATQVPPFSRRFVNAIDYAIDIFREREDDVDAATPVDAKNAPTGVWKSRKEREIPTAPTSIIFFLESEERRTKPLRSTVHQIGSPPLGHVSLDTTNIYAETDLETKAAALAHCEIKGSSTPTKHWRQDAGLMAFLKSL